METWRVAAAVQVFLPLLHLPVMIATAESCKINEEAPPASVDALQPKHKESNCAPVCFSAAPPHLQKAVVDQ